MFFMLLFVVILFGAVFGWKAIKTHIRNKEVAAHMNPTMTVSAMVAKSSVWSPDIDVVGSTRTVKGVNVTTEQGGLVEHIYFTPGMFIKKGTLMVQLDIRPDVAKLHALEADAKVADITYRRNQKQYRIGAISQETLAQDEGNYERTKADVVEQKAVIAKKTIRAPFNGKLGISLINPGQYLNPGDAIATLQTLNPIYVDFFLPQQNSFDVKIGQTVDVKVDAHPKITFSGPITTINPIVGAETRNIEVEATLKNPKYWLLPGMFVDVTVKSRLHPSFTTLPQMAVAFNPYGDIVYTLTDTGKKEKGKKVYKADQNFVTIGKTRGDQVQITKGIKAGQLIVTAGQMKLKNGSLVFINDAVKTADNPNPTPPEQ